MVDDRLSHDDSWLSHIQNVWNTTIIVVRWSFFNDDYCDNDDGTDLNSIFYDISPMVIIGIISNGGGYYTIMNLVSWIIMWLMPLKSGFLRQYLALLVL